jgi:hypothetical protein
LVVLIQLPLTDHWRGFDYALPQEVVLPQDLLVAEGGRSLLDADGRFSRSLEGIGVIGEGMGGEFADGVVRLAGGDAFEDV